MDLFLDDPNNDVDSNERNISKNIHLLGFIGSFTPPLNIILPFIYSKINTNKSLFVKQQVSNALNFQLMVLLLLLLGIVMYLFLDLFYILLYTFFLFLFQAFYTYEAFVASKFGTFNNYPFSLKIF